MAVNPGEEIVNVWLQDIKNYFTRLNINVRKETRVINGKKRGGGRGKEIDILGINNSGKKIWVEVSVSPRPRNEYSGTKNVNYYIKKFSEKFHEEKEKKVNSLFGNKPYSKMFVYSPNLFRKGEEELFRRGLEEKGIEPVDFEKIFHETIENINHYSVDPIRVYLYYSKYFPKKEERKEMKRL